MEIARVIEELDNSAFVELNPSLKGNSYAFIVYKADLSDHGGKTHIFPATKGGEIVDETDLLAPIDSPELDIEILSEIYKVIYYD